MLVIRNLNLLSIQFWTYLYRWVCSLTVSRIVHFNSHLPAIQTNTFLFFRNKSNKQSIFCFWILHSVKLWKFSLMCNESSYFRQVYSYFKKRCQKKSQHPISQDPKVVWVVSNRSLLLQLKGSSRSHAAAAEDND